jgi:hypothetical protein
MESDNLIKFNHRSIASVLKFHGSFLFDSYNSLDPAGKSLCANCLCGILDFTNTLPTSQSQLFTVEQWKLLVKRFKSRRAQYLPTLSKGLNEIVDKIKEVVTIAIAL